LKKKPHPQMRLFPSSANPKYTVFLNSTIFGWAFKASQSALRCIFHDFDNGVLDFLRHFFKLWGAEHSGRVAGMD